MAKKALRVPVSLRALLARINRKLAKDERQLKANRGGSDLGAYFLVDLAKNVLVKGHVDPEALGRELGVLRPYETVADEEGR